MLVELITEVLASRGWTTTSSSVGTAAPIDFDLVAESDSAVVFVACIEGPDIASLVDRYASDVAAVTLQSDVGVKAWEAYLILVLTSDSADEEVLHGIERDLTYCRKIVLDGAGILAAPDARDATESALGFLFPFDVAAAPEVVNVRSHLIELIAAQGFSQALVEELVTRFDEEPDCKCWSRVQFAARVSEAPE